MGANRETIRRAWEQASDEDIHEALFVYPGEYKPEALEIILAIARDRGLDVPDAADLERRKAENRKLTETNRVGDARQYDVLDKKLVCQVCGHDYFWQRSVQLNTALATFLDLDWLNRSASCLTCVRCGYIHWFA